MNYYEVLDVSLRATRDQIRTAYRIQVQLFHPDRLLQAGPGVRDYAEERLRLANQAYAVLNDPPQRARYDATLQARERLPGRTPPPPAAAPPSPPPPRPDGARAAPAGEKRKQQAVNQLTLSLGRSLELICARVPAGEFLQGSDSAKDPDASEDEYPQHRVYLPEFYIGQAPVTNAQYAAYVKATGAAAPKRWKHGAIPPGKEKHPVVCVAWDEAAAFCRWLGGLNSANCRLPTEAEWEKAARGADGHIYPWGNLWDANRINSYESGLDHTTPIRQFSPSGDSPYGAADMCGNVQEWCADWYDAAEYRRRGRGVIQHPLGPKTGIARVIRGGSFEYYRELTRCAGRNEAHPGRHVYSIGFRAVVTSIRR